MGHFNRSVFYHNKSENEELGVTIDNVIEKAKTLSNYTTIPLFVKAAEGVAWAVGQIDKTLFWNRGEQAKTQETNAKTTKTLKEQLDAWNETTAAILKAILAAGQVKPGGPPPPPAGT